MCDLKIYQNSPPKAKMLAKFKNGFYKNFQSVLLTKIPHEMLYLELCS